MKKVVKGFASVILASMIFVVGCKPPTSTSEPPSGGSEPTGQSKITITVQGDDNIAVVPENTFTVDKNTRWGVIKIAATAKIRVKENYALFEWRLNDEIGDVITTDDLIFTGSATVFAVSKEAITISAKSDERIDLSMQIKTKYNTTWADIKAEIEGKIKPSADWKDDWNKGDYALYEWRLGDENGAKISDDYRFTENTTVYAVSNYVNWKIKDGYFSDTKVLSGVNGSKPRGKIIIPNSVKTDRVRVTSIEKNAFFDCSSLTGIIIPNSVKTIGDNAFWGCSALTGITIPNSVSSIGDNAFNGCSGLTGISILDGVTSIGESAFGHCSKLTGIIIPKSVKKIGQYAFWDCSKLTSVSFADPEGWAVYDNDTYTLEETKIDKSKLAKPDATDEEKEKTAKLLTDTYKRSYWGKRLW